MNTKANSDAKQFARREFLSSVGMSVGLSMMPIWSEAEPTTIFSAESKLTVKQVIEIILAEIHGAPLKETVDTIKTGSDQQQVRGIVTTMFATIDVIRQTAAAGANFIIAHEPTFYNHQDETLWLDNDPVFQAKRDLLKRHKIVVWRFHDYLHDLLPDGVLMGVLTKLGWQGYYDPKNPKVITLPSPITVGEIVDLSKKGLGIRQVRIVGDRKQACKRIALSPGAGGLSQIQLVQEEKPDLLIVGEVNEWETAEYIRDAQAIGVSMSLIVLGHAESEEPGMEWLVPWLQPKVGNIKIKHIPSHNPFMEA